MEPYIGQIQLFAFTRYAPAGWLPCNGAELQINQNNALFSLLGTTFGGDGKTNFALPDLVGKEPIPGTTYCICVMGRYPTAS